MAAGRWGWPTWLVAGVSRRGAYLGRLLVARSYRARRGVAHAAIISAGAGTTPVRGHVAEVDTPGTADERLMLRPHRPRTPTTTARKRASVHLRGSAMARRTQGHEPLLQEPRRRGGEDERFECTRRVWRRADLEGEGGVLAESHCAALGGANDVRAGQGEGQL